jgi:hypothetical protein
MHRMLQQKSVTVMPGMPQNNPQNSAAKPVLPNSLKIGIKGKEGVLDG